MSDQASSGAIKSGESYVEFFAVDGKLDKSLTKLGNRLRAFGEFSTKAGALLSATAAGTAAGILALARSAADAGSAVDDMSQRTGIAVKFLSEMRYAAGMSGTSIETFEGGIKAMTKALYGADEESKTALKTLGNPASDSVSGSSHRNRPEQAPAVRRVYQVAGVEGDRLRPAPGGEPVAGGRHQDAALRAQRRCQVVPAVGRTSIRCRDGIDRSFRDPQNRKTPVVTNPQFSHLPAVNCPDWAPKAVRTEFEALMGSQAAIETKRAEVLEALHKARNQDLAVFTPVQYDGRPMMQAELQHRRAVAAYLRNLMASSSGFKDQCIAEERRAREEVKARLVKAGYTEPGDIPGRGDYTPDMVNRHELVRCATEKCGTAKGFDLGANIRENQQHVDELTAKLSALREAVIS